MLEIRAEQERKFALGLLDTPPERRGPWPCYSCGRPTMSYASDLALDWEQDGAKVRLLDLTGFRCSECRYRTFDAKASRIISRFIVGARAPGGYRGTVSSLGGGKLGVYLPREVVDQVNLGPRDPVLVTPVTPTKIVIEKARRKRRPRG